MKRFKRQAVFCFAIASLMTPHHVGAQPRVSTTNGNAWVMFFGNPKLSDQFGIHVEAQWRRHDFVKRNQQLLLRLGMDYYFTATNRLTVGYGFIETYPYGEFAVANAFPEHRIWEQFQTIQTFSKFKLLHRYRLEQRMIGNASTGRFEDGRFENRFRYMAKLTFDINDHLFLAGYNEVFLNFGKDVAYNIFDQNRLYAALGIKLSDGLKLEVGYLYQVIQLRSLELSATPKNKIGNNHTFQLALFSNISFYN